MSIQSNINQMVSLASLLSSQSPIAKIRKEGIDYQNKQVAAKRGLEDIEKNLKRQEKTDEFKERIGPPTKEEADWFEKEGKSYNVEELKNIEGRTREYQKDIYDAKSAALNPSYAAYINPQEINQPELSKQLSSIDKMLGSSRKKLEEVEKAKRSAAEAQITEQRQSEKSKEFLNKIMEGVYSPLTDPRKEDK